MTKNNVLNLMLCLSVLFILAACSRDKSDTSIHFSNTSMPLDLEWIKGEYNFSMATEDPSCVAPWSYQIKVDGKLIQEEYDITHTDINFVIDENFSLKKRHITIDTKTSSYDWKLTAQRYQKIGLVPLGQNLWAKGNLTLKDGKFAIASQPTEYGLLFKHKSKYGVKIDGDMYSGTAHTPEPVEISIEDMESGAVDPCLEATNGKFRLPNMSELYDLLEAADGYFKTINNIVCMSINNESILLPLSGACLPNGTIGFQNSNAGYWGSSLSENGDPSMFIITPDYHFIDYNTVGSLSAVRCVVNTVAPTYVSHTPTSLQDNKAFDLEVVTNPGEYQEYSVALLPNKGNDVIFEMASPENPTVTLSVPENRSISPIVYSIYVNEEFTGETITQPGLIHYAVYKSHTPNVKSVPEDEFILTVEIYTDLEDVSIKIEGSDGYQDQAYASKYMPKTEMTIPANTSSEDRKLSIWVNNKDTGRSIIQEKRAPKQFSVDWSEGNLTVVDGQYTFAAIEDRGLFFKYMSEYGMLVDEINGKVQYTGKAYHPDEEKIDFKAIQQGTTDPCSLVAPTNTWRLPTAEDLENLISFEKSEIGTSAVKYSDGQTDVVFYPAGMLNHSTGSFLGANFIRLWTSSVESSTEGVTITGSVRLGLKAAKGDFGQGLAIRCVKDK